LQILPLGGSACPFNQQIIFQIEEQTIKVSDDIAHLVELLKKMSPLDGVRSG